MKKLFLTIVALTSLQSFCSSQTAPGSAYTLQRDTIRQTISTKQSRDTVYFYPPKLPPLGQIAGAPTAFYNYFWELGDGAFSFDEIPAHIYKDTGTYTVRLFVTNNFDDGRAPVIQPYPVRINKKPISGVKPLSYFFNASINGNIGMKNNRDPLPGEDFVTVVGYRNKVADKLKGSLVIFYNEKQYDKKNFAVADKRLYNKEGSTSLNTLLARLESNVTLGETMLAADSKKAVEKQEIIPKDIQLMAVSNSASTTAFTINSGQVTAGKISSTNAGFAEETNNEATANNELTGEESNHISYPEDTSGYNQSSVSSGTKTFAWKASGNMDKDPYNTAADTRFMLQTLRKSYVDNIVFSFDELGKGEENFIFMTMNASPAMLQDTDAVITLTGAMIPDDPFLHPEKFELQMQVVSSHDPNRFMMKNGRINYRFLGKKKELNYRIQFENTGKGPARKVSVAIGIPPQLNAATLQIKRMIPLCEWCELARPNQSCVDTMLTADSLFFNFRNIYIPGMQQRNVKDKDSAKGMIEYSLHFKKKPKKIPFGNRAKIVFDKNEPIYTNKAMARFSKGFSPGIVAGYNLSLSNGGYSARGPLQIGYVLSPYAPSRPYFQVEAYLGLLEQQDSSSVFVYDDPPPYHNTTFIRIAQQNIKRSVQRNSINLVPLHFRYNFNNWMGIGLGAMAQIIISEKQTIEETNYLLDYSNNQKRDSIDVITTHPSKHNGSLYAPANVAGFVDLQIGRVRTGPSIGIRYLRQLRGNIQNSFFIYAGIKI